MGKYQKNIEAARRITVMQYLETYHPGELVRKTDREYCTRTHDSLIITPANGFFHWFSRNVGGNNAIDYLTKVEGMDFVSAVRLLNEMTPVTVSFQPAKAAPVKPHEPRPFTLPTPDRNAEAVAAYLMHRGISPKVLRYCVGSGILYQTTRGNYRNCVFDPVAAEVVKRIFLLANEGKSTRAIAEKLTEEKVLIPSAYAKEYHPEQYNGQKYSNSNLWGMSTVRGILERQEYLGHTVLRKTVGTNFKLHKRKSTAQDEQYLFQNTHEPIISQELWDSVHRRRKRVQRASAWGSHTNRLSGYLYCADCGRRLTLQTHYSKRDGSVQYSYRCGGYASRVNSCTAHSISADNVEALVLSSVKRFSRFVLQDENAFAAELQSLWIERLKTEPKNQQSELQRCQKRYDELSNLVRGLYENLMLGLLSERQYRQLMKQYDVEQTDLETKMDAIKSALAEEREKSGDIKQFIALIRKCKNPTEISDLMFYELIDKIVVYEAEGVSRARTQKVDIYFNYVGQVNIDYTPEEVAEIQAQEAQTAAERLQKQRAREKAYREKRKAERLAANGGELVKKQVCPQCGKIFIPASSHQTFCSEGCCHQARQDQKQAEREAERGKHYYRQRICAICGNPYWPESSRSKFCSDACRKKNHNKVTLEAYHKKRVKEQTLWKSTSPVNAQT